MVGSRARGCLACKYMLVLPPRIDFKLYNDNADVAYMRKMEEKMGETVAMKLMKMRCDGFCLVGRSAPPGLCSWVNEIPSAKKWSGPARQSSRWCNIGMYKSPD